MPKATYETPMTKLILDSMTPVVALNRLKEGNNRFMKNPRIRQKGGDDNLFINTAASGQNPFALVLSCVDSRIPTEVIFDQNIGDMFNARIAGNFVNEDILGSMEFAAKYVKVIVVMGHTSCGAIGAACNAIYPITQSPQKPDEIPPNNLLRMAEKLFPAVKTIPRATHNQLLDATQNDDNFVNRVAEKNVQLTMDAILLQSEHLRKKITEGEILLVGAMHDVSTGKVRFLDDPPNEPNQYVTATFQNLGVNLWVKYERKSGRDYSDKSPWKIESGAGKTLPTFYSSTWAMIGTEGYLNIYKWDGVSEVAPPESDKICKYHWLSAYAGHNESGFKYEHPDYIFSFNPNGNLRAKGPLGNVTIKIVRRPTT